MDALLVDALFCGDLVEAVLWCVLSEEEVLG